MIYIVLNSDELNGLFEAFRYSFICQGTSTRRQLRGLRVKLPPVTTTQRKR